MRKITIFAILFTVALLVFGCDNDKFYTVSVRNNSSKTVSYEYAGHSDTLAVQESKTYEIKEYTQPPSNIVDQNGIASLNVDRHNQKDEYIFTTATPFDLNVLNTLPVDITIKAGNYIDNNGLMELTIESQKENTGAKIYTQTPKFISTSNYPINIGYIVVGNEMFITIR